MGAARRDSEAQVAQHYARAGLEAAILEALRAAGKDPARLCASDLSGADEFHLGWRAQTVAFAEALGLCRDMHVLDVGAGLGGPARHFAEAHGCTVTGIDLTEDYVEAASALTRRCGLSDRARFLRGSALALPFEADAFDAATLIHVGMNIEDKAGLLDEVRRVLKPGARFGVFDIVRVDDGEPDYPTPWAETDATSFLEPVETYRRLLEQAGLALEQERNRRAFVLDLLSEMRTRTAAEGPPSLGLHILTGPATAERLRNVFGALERGLIAPVEFIARAV